MHAAAVGAGLPEDSSIVSPFHYREPDATSIRRGAHAIERVRSSKKLARIGAAVLGEVEVVAFCKEQFSVWHPRSILCGRVGETAGRSCGHRHRPQVGGPGN